MTFLAFIVALILRFVLKKENARREHLNDAEYEREAKIDEPCDWVSPLFFLMIEVKFTIYSSIHLFDMCCKQI